MEDVRLVIWDLDDTFWRGTLTEGGIMEFVDAHHDLVIALARRGIMSSICSKNDHATVQAILTERGLWEYFIFPSINWEPKAARVAQIIETVQLRPPTVLFVDDNPHNRGQAAELIPGLQVADETGILDFLADPRFTGKDDSDLTRLKQYKLLETKEQDRSGHQGDISEFLRSCDIRVSIETDILKHMDRTIELINRTNQLNFTKNRLPEDPDQARAALMEQLNEFDARAGLVHAADRYGDYGLVGFYLIHGHWGNRYLQHFAFSCRTLGMGVEQWVYNRIGRPPLKIIGEVLSSLDERPDWIRLAAPEDMRGPAAPAKLHGELRLRGGCDLEILADYLRLEMSQVKTELVHMRDVLIARPDHSSTLVFSLSRPDLKQQLAVASLGLAPEDFRSKFLAPCKPGDVLIYSNLGDVVTRIYRHKTLGFTLPIALLGLVDRNLFTIEDHEIEQHCVLHNIHGDRRDRLRRIIDLVRSDYEFADMLGPAMMRQNLHIIFKAIPENALFLMMVPTDRAIKDGESKVFPARTMLREAILETAPQYPAVRLLDAQGFIHSETDSQTVGHYNRTVYLRMWEKIREMIEAAGV